MSERRRRRLNYLSMGPAAPAAPTLFNAITLSDEEVSCTWSNVTGETGYSLEYALSPSGPWTVGATTGANVTTSSISGLDPYTLYYFRVRAQNSGVFGAYSNTVQAQTYDEDAWIAALGMGAENDETECQALSAGIQTAKTYLMWDFMEACCFVSPADPDWALYDSKRLLFMETPNGNPWTGSDGFLFEETSTAYVDTNFTIGTDTVHTESNSFFEAYGVYALTPNNQPNYWGGWRYELLGAEMSVGTNQEGGGSLYGISIIGDQFSDPIISDYSLQPDHTLYGISAGVEEAPDPLVGSFYDGANDTYTSAASSSFYSYASTPIEIFLGCINIDGNYEYFTDAYITFWARAKPIGFVGEAMKETRAVYRQVYGLT